MPIRYLAVKRTRHSQRLEELPEYDRRHVEDYVTSGVDQAETLGLVTGPRERVAAMGPGRFLIDNAGRPI